MLPCRTQATQRPVSDPGMPNRNRPFAGQPHLHLPGVAQQATPGDAGCHHRGANRRRSTSTAAPRQRHDRAGGAAGDADAEDAAGLIADAAVSTALEVVSSARGGRAFAGAGQEEATALARLIDEAISAGTAPDQILVLFNRDRNGAVSRGLDEALFSLGHSAHRPRTQDDDDLDLVRLQQYLQLAASLRTDSIDHLALRGLLELEDNRVGVATLHTVVDRAVEMGLQFADLIERLRNPQASGLPRRAHLLRAVDGIYDRARALEPGAGESLRTGVERVASELNVEAQTLDVVRQLLDSGAVTDPGPGSAAHPQQLLAALNGLSDALPSAVPGNVTITTMHGAKGLTADMVIVCQLEDETLPGDATGPEEAESRRLLYVSITRARRRLVLAYCGTRTGAQQYRRGRAGALAARQLTRFLRDRGLRAVSARGLLL